LRKAKRVEEEGGEGGDRSLKMEYFEKARGMYEQAVKAMSKTETEKKLAEALSNANWGASTTLMREIASLTHDWQEYAVVMKEVYAALDQQPKYWRQIFKALTLLEFLVKNGSERVVKDCREKIYQIRTLTGFSYYHDGGEKGTGVREKAKALVELLSDDELIIEERKKAAELRDKYQGIGRDGVHTMPTGTGRIGGFDRGGISSSGFGGPMGRYNDDESAAASLGDDQSLKKEKKKKKKDKKKKKQYEGDSGSVGGGPGEDDFDFGFEDSKIAADPFTDEGGGGPFDDDDFGNFEDASEKKDTSKKKKSKKKSKGNFPVKDDSEDLFGGSITTRTATQNNAFDPFAAGSSNQKGQEDAFGDFGAFESAPTTLQQDQRTDPFGALSSPGNTNAGIDDFFSGGGEMQLQSQTSQHSQMMPIMQPAAQQPQQHSMQQNVNQMAHSGSDDPWAGLVNLGNLSLDAHGRNASSHAESKQQQRRTSSIGSIGSTNSSKQMPSSVPMPMPIQTTATHQQQGQQQQQKQDDFDLLF